MNKSIRNHLIGLAVAGFCALAPDRAVFAVSASAAQRSVVKIYVTWQQENYALPWQGGRPASGTGSGLVISRRRILTNAHIASDARFIEVQKAGDARKFTAKPDFLGHDCDLATLVVDDPSFFDGTTPMKLAEFMPKLNDEVTVVGYPIGGEFVSVTKGVVSRVDYSIYSHSGVDQHLVLQVDAAINPGSSGGPIIFKGRVVGLAFQGLAWAENIGYGIPLPVIRHFLDDIEDGTYHGYPELGVGFLEARNPALRDDLKLPDHETGVVIYYIDPFGSAKGHLLQGDVLLSIDGYMIGNDGTIQLDGSKVVFAELLERKQWGESILLRVWRNGNEIERPVTLRNPPDPFAYRNLYGQRPEYLMVGGLVFSALSRPYLNTLQRDHRSGMNSQRLSYYTEYAKMDELYSGRDEFVVLIQRLPHAVNTYADEFVNGIVHEVNGVVIHNLRDLKQAISRPENGFHVFRFDGVEETLVLNADAALRAGPKILAGYGIPSPEYFRNTSQ